MTSDTAAASGVDVSAEADAAPTDTEVGRRPARPRGRKRDTELTAAILDAASEILLEQGVDGMRVQDVAERAESGTGAIYRRWKTKESLIAEAIRCMPSHDLPTSGDPVDDLRATLETKFAAALAQPDLLPSMVSAIRCDEDIAAAVDDVYDDTPIRQAIARVVGDDHPLLDTLTELMPALALYRASFRQGRALDGQLVDDVMSVVGAVTD